MTTRPGDKARSEWPSHAKIVELVISHLSKDRWSVATISESEKVMLGTDLIAKRDGEELIVAIKGYPATLSARGLSRPSSKPTLSWEQAHHWYGQVLMNALLRQSLYPDARMCIALPDYDVLTNILPWIKAGLDRLGVGVLYVREQEVVEASL